MAVYEDYAVSVESSQPVELTTIAIGVLVYRFNDSIDSISHDSETFISHQVAHSQITTGEEPITVTMNAEHTYPQMYINAAPGRVATVTIQRLERGIATDVKVIYKGIVRNVSFNKDMTQAKLAVVPISSAFDKEIPDRTYQSKCNHVLFSDECGLSNVANQFIAPVSAAADNTITVTGIDSKGADWATGGYVSLGGDDYRLVLGYGAATDVLVLNLAFFSAVVGENVTVYAGCDGLLTTCQNKFAVDNHINFGGTPFVPSKNVFQSGIE